MNIGRIFYQNSCTARISAFISNCYCYVAIHVSWSTSYRILSYHEVGNCSAIVGNGNLSSKVWYFVLAGANTQCRISIYISCNGRLDSIGNKYQLYRIDNRNVSADINEPPCTLDGVGTSCGNHTAIGVCKCEVPNGAAIVGECCRDRMRNSSVCCKCACIRLVNRDCRWYGISRRILVLTADAHCRFSGASCVVDIIASILYCIGTCDCPIAIVGACILISMCYGYRAAVGEQCLYSIIFEQTTNVGIGEAVVLTCNIVWPCVCKCWCALVATAYTHSRLGCACCVIGVSASILYCIGTCPCPATIACCR